MPGSNTWQNDKIKNRLILSGSSAEADARLIDYRTEKVAGFEIDTETMICLPQVSNQLINQTNKQSINQ